MNRWTPEAEDLKASGTSGTMAGGGAKAILHVTVSPSGGGYFDAMHRVLTTNKAEPHYLYDPLTDRLGQYFALDRSSRSLRTGTGPVSCNKAGSVVIQIEVVGWPGTNTASSTTTAGGFTSLWKPGPNFRAMMRDIRAAGVPDTFPMGSTAPGAKRATYADYQARAGWFGHCHVPGQDHWDPGLIDTAAFFAAAPVTAPTKPKEGALMALTDAEQAELLAKVRNLDARLADGGRLGNAIVSSWLQMFYGSPTYGPPLVKAFDPAKFAAAVAAALPAGATITQDDLVAAMRTVLGSLDNTPEASK